MKFEVLLFAKAPLPGHVKTRLTPSLAPAAAAALSRRLTETALSQCVAAAIGPVSLWLDRSDTGLERAAASAGATVRWQGEGNLGERLGRAVVRALDAGRSPLLVGGDCPFYDAPYLRAAAAGLADGAQAVLGPADDGGFVLLGLRRWDGRLFEAMRWGEACVGRDVRARLTALGWTWHCLENRADIDRPEDLELLRARGWDISE